MCGTEAAFAALLEDTSVVTWEHVRLGGDRFELPHQLQNVRKIFANQDAFAALLKNGSNYGDLGQSSTWRRQFRNPKYTANYDFAAILADGSLVTWGSRAHGGDRSRVQHQLQNVKEICGDVGGFAAVVTWGMASFGGDSSSLHGQLRNVRRIFGAFPAFAAILQDETVVTWGLRLHGGDGTKVQHTRCFCCYCS